VSDTCMQYGVAAWHVVVYLHIQTPCVSAAHATAACAFFVNFMEPGMPCKMSAYTLCVRMTLEHMFWTGVLLEGPSGAAVLACWCTSSAAVPLYAAMG
jgi:hypothetical protein